MTKSLLDQSAPVPALLTPWANEEAARLKADFHKKRDKLRKDGVMGADAQLHPQLKPIFDNFVMLAVAFDPDRKRGTGRLRMLFAMHSFVRSRSSGDRRLWPAIATLMTMAGFSDRKNANQTIADLERIGLVDVEDGAGPGGTNIYHLGDGHLIDMIFSCATGEAAIYALALRELRINARGVGKSFLSRQKVRDALAEGVRRPDGSLVLDRSLTSQMIVLHLEALQADGRLIKLGDATATVPGAVGEQIPAMGRFWERKDKGKPKSRTAKKSIFVEFTPLPDKDEFAPLPERSFVDFVPSPQGT